MIRKSLPLLISCVMGCWTSAMATDIMLNTTTYTYVYEHMTSGGDLKSTVNGVYEISSAEDLLQFAHIVNGTGGYQQDRRACAVLTQDIDLSEVCGPGKGSWPTIGNSVENAFDGKFSGNFHRIKNLYINEPEGTFQGLFGCAVAQVDNTLILDVVVDGQMTAKSQAVGILGGRLPSSDTARRIAAFDKGVTGIEAIETDKASRGESYNLQGIPVNDDYKGIVIYKGRKILR